MKEFSEDIEQRMGRAFKSKAGKKYGMSEVELEMKRVQSHSTFGELKENINDVDI